MKLLRLTGKGGTHIYDIESMSKEEARSEYVHEYGYDADAISHELEADDLSGKQLALWVSTGEI